MNKKLFTQIRNEWRSNLWLLVELVLVSVVLWWIVDYLYVQEKIYSEPLGFDISNCYLITMGKLTEKSPDFIPDQTEEQEQADVQELLLRLSRRDDVEVASLSMSSYPYNGSNSSQVLRWDTLSTSGWLVLRRVSPDFVRVFRYQGARGETPEQLAEVLERGDILLSNNIFNNTWMESDYRASDLIGEEFCDLRDSTECYRLGAAIQPVRYADNYPTGYSISVIYPQRNFDSTSELCVRVKPQADAGFAERLRAESEKLYRVGNLFIADIKPFTKIKAGYLQGGTNLRRSYFVGMSFLMLNIFLGLLGTFWFRTQQRRSEIALMKALGGTERSVFVRLISEGLILLGIATVLAIFIDWNLTYAELNAWLDGSTFALGRFSFAVLVVFALVALMIVIGIWIPARRAMRVQPAEALHDE